MSESKKVRLANGPFVSPEMHADVTKRAEPKDMSIGKVLEKDWAAAQRYGEIMDKMLELLTESKEDPTPAEESEA